MPTPTNCRKCNRLYYGAAGMLCRECEVLYQSDISVYSSNNWRSFAFWDSDIENITRSIINNGMEYPTESRAEFFRDVMSAINCALLTDTSTPAKR